MEETLEELVSIMREALNSRGFYLLMDNRLDLVCGPGCSGRRADRDVVAKVEQFAAQQGWVTSLGEEGYVFRARK